MKILEVGSLVEYFECELQDIDTGGAGPYKKWVKVYKEPARFQIYGLDYEESEHGVGTYSTAVLLLRDGTIKNIPIENIKVIQ